MSYESKIGGKLIVTAKGDIKNFAKGDIVINSNKNICIKGLDKGVSLAKPETFKSESENFEISLSLNKKENTIVPLGILDFENNYENRFFVFDYSLKLTNLDSLNFQIFNDKDELIYQMNNLAPIVVTAPKAPKLFSKLKEETPVLDPLKPIKTFDVQKLIDDYLYPDLTHTGNYLIFWDGFDNNEVYDSTCFEGKKLKAKITGKKGGTTKVQEVQFETSRKEVDWVDVKIDKKAKRIDVTLRVDLKDGGANGLDCKQVLRGMRDNTRWETQCPWDKIPKNVTMPNKPIIKNRTKTFEELKKYVFDGLKHYWGRNKTRSVGNHVKIIDSFEVFIHPVDTKIKALNSLPLMYVTNGNWMRSGNPGGSYSDKNLDDDALDILPDLGVIQRLSYNTGYIKHDWDNDKYDGWRYHTDTDNGGVYDAITEFKETAAHEIGHELLQAYGGTVYSWQHKGSSYYLPQDTKPIKGDETIWGKIKHLDEMPQTSGEYYPKAPNEIDLMKYYNSKDKKGNFVAGPDINRLIAAEKDVLSLIWLTKIKIQ